MLTYRSEHYDCQTELLINKIDGVVHMYTIVNLKCEEDKSWREIGEREFAFFGISKTDTVTNRYVYVCLICTPSLS